MGLTKVPKSRIERKIWLRRRPGLSQAEISNQAEISGCQHTSGGTEAATESARGVAAPRKSKHYNETIALQNVSEECKRYQEIYRNLEWCLSLHTVPRMFTRCRLSVSCHGEDLQGFGWFLPNTRAIMTHTQDDPRTTKLQRLHKVVKDEHEERRRKAAGSQSYRQDSYTCPRIALDATNEYLVFMLCSLLLYPCFCFCKLKPDLGRIIERERERERASRLQADELSWTPQP